MQYLVPVSRRFDLVLAYLLTTVALEHVFLSEICRLTTKPIPANANYAAAVVAGQMFGAMEDEKTQAYVTGPFGNWYTNFAEGNYTSIRSLG